MRNLDLLILLGALIVFFGQLYYATPATSDAYENFRIVQYFEEGGNFPIESAAIMGAPYVYPPVFSLSLLNLKSLTGAGYYFSLSFISYACALILISAIFLLTKSTVGDEKKALLGVLGIFTIPILIYRLITPIAETLGVAFFLLSLYFYQMRNWKMMMLILVMFPFVHSRSFIFTIIAIGLAAVMRGDIGRSIKHSLPAVAVFLIYHIAFPVYPMGFENPSIVFPSLFEMVSPLGVAMLAIGIVLLLKKGQIDHINGGIVASLVLCSLILPFPFRHVIFLIVPMASFSGEILNADRRILAIFSVFLALTVAHAIEGRTAPLDPEAINAIASVKDFGGKDALASFKHNYALPFLAGKKVIVGAFAEGLQDGSDRAKALDEYFAGEDGNTVFRKYGSTIGFFEKGEDKFAGSGEARLLESDHFVAYSYIRRT